MIAYLLQVSFCWIFFYGIYHAFLRKETFFSINRGYLLSTLLFSLFVPQIGGIVRELIDKTPADMGEMIYYFSETPNYLSNAVTASSAEGLSWWMICLIALYALGVLVKGIKFGMGLGRILKLFRSGTKITQEHFVLIETNHLHLPFSFFHYVFLSKKLPLNKDVDQIIRHELSHVSGLHSLDILVVESLHILFWFNPILILYKNALRHAHEYTADASVLESSSIKNYGQILLGQTSSGLEVALANHFFNSQIKNRITMMYQKKSGRSALVKYLAAVPVLILTVFLFSNSVLKEGDSEFLIEVEKAIATAEGLNIHKDVLAVILKFKKNGMSEESIENNLVSLEKKTGVKFTLSLAAEDCTYCMDQLQVVKQVNYVVGDSIPVNKVIGEVLNSADEMPRFPGCEGNENMSISEKEQCAKGMMLRYIYSTLEYPEIARKNDVEGMTVIQFVITKEGKIENVNIVRDIGSNCGDAAAHIVKSMNGMTEKWTPGIHNGNPVNVLYTLPVRFKLNGEKKEVEEIIEQSSIISGDVLNEADEMPRFPGCESEEGMSIAEKDACSKQKLLAYIYRNIKYPADARKKGIQGMVVTQFIVKSDGTIADVKLLRDIGGGCGKNAMEVMTAMSDFKEKWIPGKQDGKAVNVRYTVPVRYKIDGDKLKNDVEEIVEVKDNFLGENKHVVVTGLPIDNAEPLIVEEIVEDNKPAEILEEIIEQLDVTPLGDNSKLVINADNLNVKEKDTHINIIGDNISLGIEPSDKTPLYIIDGKIIGQKLSGEVELSPDDIKEINVYKGVKAIKKYGSEAKNGAVEIYTKKGSDNTIIKAKKITLKGDDGEKEVIKANSIAIDPLYVLDGKVLGKGENKIKDLNPEEIEAISVLKGKSGIDKYGNEARDGVVEITTKNNKQIDAQDKISWEDNISTIDGVKSIKMKDLTKFKSLIVVDDKMKGRDASILEKMDTDKIDHLNVLDEKSGLKKYGPEGSKGVIEVFTKESKINRGNGEVFNVAEKMPLFPGYVSEKDSKIDQENSNQALLDFVYENLVYPAAAKKARKEGMNVVQFTITKEGRIRDAKLVRDIGAGTGDAVLVMMDRMADISEPWTPAYQNGKAVNIKFTLPIRFKMSEEEMIISKELKGVNEGKFLSQFKIFPNPSKGGFNLEFKGDKGRADVHVFSIDGKVLYQETVGDFNGYYNNRIESESFVNMQAIVTISQGNKVETKRIVFSE